jgi:PAS domain S-box-containing protein
MLLLKLITLTLQLLIVAGILQELSHPLYHFHLWKRAWIAMLVMSCWMTVLLTWNVWRTTTLGATLLLAGVVSSKLVGLWHLRQIFGAELVLPHVTDAAFIEIDSFSTIVVWDAQATRLFGWTATDALGQTLMQTIIPSRDWEAHRDGLARLLATGDEGRVIARTFAVNAMRKAGDEIPVTIRITSLLQEDGSLHFLGQIRELGVL